MNLQALMKQAQKLQKDMLSAKEEIDNTLFTGENSLVKVTMKGTREVIKVEISSEDSLDKDDIEMLQDMILVAVNEASSKIDKMTEEKLGKYGNSMPGLF